MAMKHTSRRSVVWLLATAALLALVSCEPAVISGGRLVESITISAAGGAAAISASGGTLQLVAEVLPSSAANKSLRWSVISGGLYANVSETGLVTALGNGTATIRARAQDGSGVYGDIEVDISGQPADGTLTFSLTSSGTPISEAQPAYYIISTSELFSDSSPTLAVKITEDGPVSQALPPGNYYLRIIHDLNNNGSLDAGDKLSVAADYQGGEKIIFSPMQIIIPDGGEKSIEADTLPALGSHGSWTWPANPGTLRVSLGYTGSLGPVSGTKRLFLGISANSDLTDRDGYIADIGVGTNNRVVLAILSSGTYYLSSFFDQDGNADLGSPAPSVGDPAQVYNGKAFASGEGEEPPYAHQVGIDSGSFPEATIGLNDTLLYSPPD